MKIIKYILSLSILLVLFPSCENSNDENYIAPGDSKISLSGISLLNDGITGDNIYLMAYLTGAPYVYLGGNSD